MEPLAVNDTPPFDLSLSRRLDSTDAAIEELRGAAACLRAARRVYPGLGLGHAWADLITTVAALHGERRAILNEAGR